MDLKFGFKTNNLQINNYFRLANNSLNIFLSFESN